MTVPTPHSGFRFVPGYLDRPAQEALLSALRSVLAAAPAYTPRMPKSGKPLSVRMTNCGPLGWVTDEAGYRYQALHPETGQPWPAMPGLVVEAWKALARYPHAPESCLVNYYGPAAKMGLHQDRDERDLGAPVVSLSLGDTCLFRIGGTKRSDPTRSHSPCLRGRRGARRRGAISLPRRRPHHPRDFDPVAGRRAHQSHAATGHRADGWQLVPRTRSPLRNEPLAPANFGIAPLFPFALAQRLPILWRHPRA